MALIDDHYLLIELCNAKESIERAQILSKAEFKDPAVLNNFIEIISETDNDEEKKNYSDHMNLIVDYNQNGKQVLERFVSKKQAIHCFNYFSNGFDSFEKRKGYLFENIFLIEKNSIDWINDYIEVNRNYPMTILGNLRFYRNLLRACKSLGIEKAFLEFQIPEQKYFDAFICISQSDSLADVMKTTAFLKDTISSNFMRNVFHFYQAQYEDDVNKKARLFAMWDTISIFQKNADEIWFWN